MMQRLCLLIILMCFVFCAVIECKNVRRHDVHRIVLKTKNRHRPKKPTRPSMHQDFHHNRFRYEDTFDPNFDQFGDHTNHHDVYSERPLRYHNRNRHPYKNFDQRPTYGDHKLYDYRHHLGDYEGSTEYRASYKDFERYRAMMDQYNKRLEEKFRNQVEKGIKPYVEDESPPVDTHERPIVWKSPKTETIKGEWSPMSSVEYPTNSKYNDVIYDLSASSSTQNIELIEITTSKPQKRPPMIVESNRIKRPSKQKTHNFNSNPFYNHQVGNKTHVERQRGTDNSYEVHEEVGESVLSPIVANFQNVVPSSSSSYVGSWEKPVVGDAIKNEGFGARTKSRRAKRPAVSSQ